MVDGRCSLFIVETTATLPATTAGKRSQRLGNLGHRCLSASIQYSPKLVVQCVVSNEYGH